MSSRITAFFTADDSFCHKIFIHKKKLADGIFWTAFILEALWFTLKKFDIDISSIRFAGGLFLPESFFLRAICGLFCIKILLTRYSKQEWCIFIPCALLGVIAYFASERGIDILFRASVMVFAAKDVSRTRAFRILFYALLISDLWIIGSGLLGSKMLVDVRDYGRGEIERRYTLGFSHANTFHFAMWSLMMLIIYLYHAKLRLWHYTIMVVLGLVITYLTRSRTGGLLMLFTLALCCLFLYAESLRHYWRFWLFCGMFCLAGCLLLSLFAAISGTESTLMDQINSLLTGRIWLAREAVQVSFLSPFSRQGNELLIDMGYVRLIYSYGVIPAALYTAATVYLIYYSCKARDFLSYVFVLSMVIFTTIEPQQVNCDIVFNYTLILLFGRWITDRQEHSEAADAEPSA